MINRILNIISIIFLINSLNSEIQAQSNISKCSFCGTWKVYKKINLEGDDGTNTTFSGKPFSTDLEFIFNEKKVKWFHTKIKEVFKEFDYSIKNDTLIFSKPKYNINEKYKIIRKTLDTLIITHKNDLAGFTYYTYKRKT